MTTTNLTPFSGRLLVGKTTSFNSRGKEVPADVHVDVKWDGTRLSIRGGVRRKLAADIDSGGQIVNEVAQIDAESLLINYDDRDRLVSIWERWHLNDMRAGCEHQRHEGWDERRIDPSKPADSYGRHFEGQQQDSWNLLGWVRPDEHPEGLLEKPCDMCGYGYGTAWLTEDVPAEVLDFLRNLVNPPLQSTSDTVG